MRRNPGEDFSPLTRKTRAASGFLHDDDNGQFFFLEDPSVQGYSGAPVFYLGDAILTHGIQIGGGKTGCYGVISFTSADNTGGKMAGVVPIKFALELMAKHEAKP